MNVLVISAVYASYNGNKHTARRLASMKHNGSIKMKCRMAAGLFAACLVFFGVAVQAKAATFTCIVADGQYVNVRNQASSSAATWGILHHGDTIEAKPGEITNGYFKTMFEDRIAYVSVRYFEIPVGRDYMIEANGRVRVRKSPGGDAIGFVRPGETVHVQAWRYAVNGSKWAKCSGGKYISADCLSEQK